MLVHPTGERDQGEPERIRQRGHGAQPTKRREPGSRFRNRWPADEHSAFEGSDQVFGHNGSVKQTMPHNS
jgi:hypothetical protein